MQFKRVQFDRIYDVPETDELRPIAVPGGMYIPGAKEVKVCMQSSSDEECGMWAMFPVMHCSRCDVPNHRPICDECSERRSSTGKFSKQCVHCGKSFKSSKHWQRTCTMSCRIARTKKLQREWHRKQKQ